MKVCRGRTVLLAAFLCVLAAFAPARTVPESAEGASAVPGGRSLTLMVYMCGSNLESRYGSASADYREMTAAGTDPGVSVLVMMGGSSFWHIGLDAGKTSVMEIGSRGSRKVLTSERMNMGDGSSLAFFLRRGMETCPAEEYALILWDHGGGPLDGLCWDETYDADRLSLSELTEALEETGFGSRKLKWIGFDACLMSSAEVASAVSPYAEYMISSQAEEPGTGWNYSFLRGLRSDRDAEETGRRIIDAYFSVGLKTERDLTLSCLRLSGMAELTDAMDGFFGDLAGNVNADSFPDLSRIRMTATGFGRAVEVPPDETGYDLVDLLSLTRSYAARNPEKAGRVEEALNRTVVFQRSNVEGACGLSVYHPWRNREKYRGGWRDLYGSLSFCGGYTRYISLYGSIMLGERLTRWDRLDRISSFTEEDSGLSGVVAELTEEQAENLAGARLVILARNLYDSADDSYFMVYRSPAVQPEGNRLSAAYDGRHLRAVNASGYTELTGALSYQITDDGVYQIRLYPFDEEGGRNSLPVVAEYVPDASGQFRLKDFLVYDELTESWTSRAEVDLTRYSGLTFLNEYRIPTVNERGELLSFGQWREDAHTDTHWKSRYDLDRTDFLLSFGSGLLRAEALYAAFEITDAQGYQVMTSLTPLEEGGLVEVPVSVPGADSALLLEGRPLELSSRLYLQGSPNPGSARIIVSLTLRNPLDRDLIFLLTDTRLNGKASDVGALNAQGTGQRDQNGRRALAPGETAAASLVLRCDDIRPLIPDVSLTEIGFSVYLGTVEDGNSELKAVIPFTLATDIPLTDFCPETDVLPPSWLVDYGREIGALSPENDRTLFSGRDVEISLNGLYVTDRSLVLLLRCQNSGGVSRHYFIGNAGMDGSPASIGRTRDVSTVVRNRRNRMFRLGLPEWTCPTGVSGILPPGASAYEYVVMKPVKEDQTEVRALSFRALVYDADNPLDAVFFSDAVISSVEAAPLEAEVLGVAPAGDYTVAAGEPLPAETGVSLADAEIPSAESEKTFRIRVADESGEPVVSGFYALFRRVSSDAELASVNVLNPVLDDTLKQRISFGGGKEWLIYEALGDLTPQADGSASALFPGLLPCARAGGEAFRLTPARLYENPDGKMMFGQVGNHLAFGSVTFPGAVLESALGYLTFSWEPESGEVELAGWKQLDGIRPSLAETVIQSVFLIPADSGTDELRRFLEGDLSEAPDRLRQYQRMEQPRISFALEPVSDPEKYVVVFLYVTESGRMRCLPPVPLNSF